MNEFNLLNSSNHSNSVKISPKKKKNPINQNYPSISILIPKMKSFSKSSFPLFLSFQEKLFLLKSNGRIYSTLLLNNKINKLCGKKEDFVNYEAIFMIVSSP
jgi:hypothetical protein